MKTKIHNRITTMIALLLAGALVFAAGCSLPTTADSTTITVDEYGNVTEAIVETGGSDFTEKDLAEYIEAETEAYNSANGEDSVTLDSCSVSGGEVKIKMKYNAWEHYRDFNNVNCFQGTLQEATDAGYDLSVPLLDSAGTAASAEILQERRNEWKVIIVEEPLTVKVPDKILYASENVTITGRLSAVVDTVLSGDREADSYSRYAQVSDINAYIVYK